MISRRRSFSLLLAPWLSGPALASSLSNAAVNVAPLSSVRMVATEFPPTTVTPPEPSSTELTTFAVPPARTMAGPLFESRIVLDETLIVASLPATMPPGMAVRP